MGRLFGAEQIREVPLWVGRDRLLAELSDELLVRRRKVLVLVGQGGIGKTSLAVKLLEACGVEVRTQRLTSACGFARVLYVRVQEGLSFDGVVSELARGLEVSLSEGMQPGQMIDSLIGALQRSHCLLVLDNLEDVLASGKALSVEWGQLLWALVDRSHDSQVVITSREVPIDLADQSGMPNPALVRTQNMGGIAIENGIALLRKQGVTDSDEDLRWVAERVGGHVQLLTFLANIAAAEYPGYLRQHPELVTDKATPIVTTQLERQTKEARSLLRKMCVLRSGINVEGLTFLRLYNRGLQQDIRFIGMKWWKRSAKFSNREISKTQSIIDSLIRCCLVEFRSNQDDKEKFYTLHNVVSETVKSGDSSKLPDLMNNVYSFYRSGLTVDCPKTLEDLRPILEAQHFAFQLRNYTEAISLVIGPLEKYLKPWGYWILLKDLCEQVLPYSKGIEYRICKQILGVICRDTGNWDMAEHYFKASLAHAQDTNSKSGMATSWGLLGDIERNRGNWDASERLYRQCLQVEEELGDRSGMASSWGVLGDIERNRGNWDAAERLYRQSLQLREELGDRSGMATSWGLLGDIERKRGNWDAAERLYRQSLQLREELGDRSGIATSYNVLAHVKFSKGDLDSAEKLYCQSLEILEDLGDRSYIHYLWANLGNIERNRGSWDAAERLYRQSLQLREELGDRSGMASSWGVLGDIECNRGNWDAAERLYRQSLQLNQELGDRSGMAYSIGSLGEVELERGNLETAESFLKDALQRFEELGDRQFIAEVHYRLMQLEDKRNNPELAQQHYTIAHQLFTQLGAAKDIEKLEARGGF